MSCILTSCHFSRNLFVWQVTILREFCQGPNEMMYSLPAGSFDARRHSTFVECARAELWEEVSSVDFKYYVLTAIEAVV